MTSFFDLVEEHSSLLKAEVYKWYMDRYNIDTYDFDMDEQFDNINALDEEFVDEFVNWYEEVKKQRNGFIYIAYTFISNRYLVDYSYFLGINKTIIYDSNPQVKYMLKLEIKNPEEKIEKIYAALDSYKLPGGNRGWYEVDDVKTLINIIKKEVK